MPDFIKVEFLSPRNDQGERIKYKGILNPYAYDYFIDNGDGTTDCSRNRNTKPPLTINLSTLDLSELLQCLNSGDW